RYQRSSNSCALAAEANARPASNAVLKRRVFIFHSCVRESRQFWNSEPPRTIGNGQRTARLRWVRIIHIRTETLTGTVPPKKRARHCRALLIQQLDASAHQFWTFNSVRRLVSLRHSGLGCGVDSSGRLSP